MYDFQSCCAREYLISRREIVLASGLEVAYIAYAMRDHKQPVSLLQVQEIARPRRKPEQASLDLGVQVQSPAGGIRTKAGSPPAEQGLPLFEQPITDPNQITI